MNILITIYIIAAFFITAKGVFDYNIVEATYGQPDSTDVALSLTLGAVVGLVGWFILPFFVLWKIVFKTTLIQYADKLKEKKRK